MRTPFALIVSAFIDALDATPAIADVVLRASDRAAPEDKAKAINVVFMGASPQRGTINGAPVDWLSRIGVECYAKTKNDTPDVVVDDVMKAAYERLASDRTLGGVVDDIGEPEIRAEYDSHGQKTGWVLMTYTVLHRTQNNTLEAA